MDKEKRAAYLKEYWEKFSDKMREQIKDWHREHPAYSKEWLKSHTGYFTNWCEKHRNRLREYRKFYMRKYRRWKKLRSKSRK